MGKKKRKRERKTNIFIAREGDREEIFINYLQSLFDPEKKITLNFPLEKGGNSNVILDRALKSFYSKVYAWFDEDDGWDDDRRNILEKRWNINFPSGVKDRDLQSYNTNLKNPIIIVSTPLSVEGMLIRLFDFNLPTLISPVLSKDDFEENKKRMKTSVKGFMGGSSDLEYYKTNLTKEKILLKAKDIVELQLLLSIFNVKSLEEGD